MRRIRHTVSVDIASTVEDTFDFVTAVETPAKVFAGYGPIPAVLETTVVGGGPLREGSLCRARNSDGSEMTRAITVHQRPLRHEYFIDGDGFRPLFRMMVRGGTGTWVLSQNGASTRLAWTYEFELRALVWWLAAFLLVRLFFAPAMRRCVLATKLELEGSRSTRHSGSAFGYEEAGCVGNS